MTRTSPSPKEGLVFRILQNSGIHLGGTLFVIIVGLATNILTARSLGAEAYGQYSFIYVFLSFFEMFVDFGLNNILTREAVQDRALIPRLLGNAVLFRLGLLAISIPFAWLLISFLKYPWSVRSGVFLASFQLLLGMKSIFEIIFRINLTMAYSALWNAVRVTANLALIGMIVAWAHPAIPLFIMAGMASGFLGLAGLLLTSFKYISYDFKPDWPLLRRIVKASWPILISSLMTVLYSRIDILMLSRMRGFSEVGQYNVALRITENLSILASALMVSLFPLLSETFKHDRAKFDRLTVEAFKWLLMASLPMAVGGLFTARELIVLLFGPAYAFSATALTLLLWTTIFCYEGNLLVNILYACHRQSVDAWISFLMVLTGAGLNYVLIPIYGYNGSAAAAVFNVFFACAAMIFCLLRVPGLGFPAGRLKSAAMAVLKVNIVFAAFLALMKYGLHLPVVPLIAAGLVVYGLILFGFKELFWGMVKQYVTRFFSKEVPKP